MSMTRSSDTEKSVQNKFQSSSSETSLNPNRLATRRTGRKINANFNSVGATSKKRVKHKWNATQESQCDYKVSPWTFYKTEMLVSLITMSWEWNRCHVTYQIHTCSSWGKWNKFCKEIKRKNWFVNSSTGWLITSNHQRWANHWNCVILSFSLEHFSQNSSGKSSQNLSKNK